MTVKDSNFEGYKVLFIHCSLTCIHFTGALLFIYFYKHLYMIELHKYIFLLFTVFIVDLLKLLITSSKLHFFIVEKQDLTYPLNYKNLTRFLKSILKLVFTLVGVTITYHVIIVLFGAPFMLNCEKTFLLAVTLTMLTAVPISLHLGLDNLSATFIEYHLQLDNLLVEAMKTIVKTVLLCTWISAFVFPLDWDRPWQAWPIPCVIGALMGYFVGHLVTFISICYIKLKKKTKRTTLKNC